MAETQALPITGIGAITATDDGRHALIKLRLGDEDVPFSIPTSLLQPLLSLICTGIELTVKAQSRQQMVAFPVSRVEVGKTATENLLATFHLNDDSRLSFVLDPSQASDLQRQLGASKGAAPKEQTPSTKLN